MGCLETLICDMFNVEETALAWTTWSLYDRPHRNQ